MQIAGQAAARANGIGTYYQCSEGDHCDGGASPQVMLTVDYSRAALTAILWIVDDRVFEYRRTRHDVDLGADTLSRCQHSQIDESCYEGLAAALGQVVKMPLEDFESDVPGVVGAWFFSVRRPPIGALDRSCSRCWRSRVCRSLWKTPNIRKAA